MSQTKELTTLEEFVLWARKCGHYQVAPLYENFTKYKANAQILQEIGDEDEEG